MNKDEFSRNSIGLYRLNNNLINRINTNIRRRERLPIACINSTYTSHIL